MNLNQIITIIPNFFSLFYVQNTGAAFSILSDNTPIIVCISMAFIVFLDRQIEKEKNMTNLLKFSYGIILGGVFGNLVDRALNHAVIDYLSFQFFHYSFPIFNLADIAITVGVALVIIDMFLERKKKKGENHE